MAKQNFKVAANFLDMYLSCGGLLLLAGFFYGKFADAMFRLVVSGEHLKNVSRHLEMAYLSFLQRL